MLTETYGVNVSAGLIRAITDKVWPLGESWQNRPLSTIYPLVYLDAMSVKLRREGKVEQIAVYSVLGVDLEGYRDVLGHWVGDGAEGANFWLSVVSDLQGRGGEDIFIACIDGLTGFADAIEAVFPKTQIQRCIVHQIRGSLKDVVWKDQKALMTDLRKVYQAPTREEAETQLLHLGETWGDTDAMAVRSWENHWDSLSTFFEYPNQIRRLIYTPNSIEGDHRQLRQVTKTKGACPTDQAVRKLLYLTTERLTTTGRAAPKMDQPFAQLGPHSQSARHSVRGSHVRLIPAPFFRLRLITYTLICTFSSATVAASKMSSSPVLTA